MGINKRQRYAILAFLKIGPHVLACSCNFKCWLIMIDQRQVTNQVCGVVPMYGLHQA